MLRSPLPAPDSMLMAWAVVGVEGEGLAPWKI